MEYLTKAWQHRLYSFNWPIQIRWQALKPSLKAKLNLTHWWLIYKHILKSYIIFWYSFFVQDTFVYIKYSGKVHASIHVCAHTHIHTCKETRTFPLTHTYKITYKHIQTHSSILCICSHLHYKRDCHLITSFLLKQHNEFQYVTCCRSSFLFVFPVCNQWY